MGLFDFFREKSAYNRLYSNPVDRFFSAGGLEHTPELTQAAQAFLNMLETTSSGASTLMELFEAFKAEVEQHGQRFASASERPVKDARHTPTRMRPYDYRRAKMLVELIDDIREIAKGPRKGLMLSPSSFHCMLDCWSLLPGDDCIKSCAAWGDLYRAVANKNEALEHEVRYQRDNEQYKKDMFDNQEEAEFLSTYAKRIAAETDPNRGASHGVASPKPGATEGPFAEAEKARMAQREEALKGIGF